MDGCLPADLLEGFDADLQTFYHGVLAQELDGMDRGRAVGVKNALREVTRAYRKDTVDSHSSHIRFNTPEKRCAYVMKHCPCFSSAVAKHLSRWLRADPDALREAVVRRRRVEVCCLGGGPATDAVGVAKVVNAFNDAVLVRSAARLILKVRVVDLSGEWRATTTRVLRALSEDRALCDPLKMSLDFEFLGADLTEAWPPRLREVLREADLVTAVYFVSAVNGSRSADRCLGMLQNIMESLKPGALFFFLDSAKDIHCESILEAARTTGDLRRAYGPRLQTFHALSMASVRRFIRLYYASFRAILCLTHCFVTTCGWVKGWTRSDGLEAGLFRKGRRWHKRVVRNTRTAERYRERVERLLVCELDMDFATPDDSCQSDSPSEPECPPGDRKRVLNASKAKRKRIYAWRE